MASTEPPFYPAANTPSPSPQITARDIVFQCSNCDGELVVDQEGAGLECVCAHCGASLVIPPHSPASLPAPVTLPVLAVPLLADPLPGALPPAKTTASPVITPAVPTTPARELPPHRQFDFGDQTPEQLTRRLEELKHQLKENMSQDTEMRGHVNRATMELHRLQLRLKKLQDRQRDIEAEITAARDWLQSASA